jgi:hypothetical protein
VRDEKIFVRDPGLLDNAHITLIFQIPLEFDFVMYLLKLHIGNRDIHLPLLFGDLNLIHCLSIKA